MDQIEVFGSRFPHSRLRLFEHSSSGIASRLNALASHATYDFLCILDSDDRMLPTRIDKQVKFLISNPTCAVFGSAISIIDQNGRKIGEKGFSTRPEIIRKNRYSHLPIAHPSAAIRKKSTYKYWRLPRFLFSLRGLRLMASPTGYTRIVEFQRNIIRVSNSRIASDSYKVFPKLCFCVSGRNLK